MVALAHAGVSVAGHHLGVPAVVVFYMLSGYVVASLLAPGSPMSKASSLFYRERALRLLPQYYFFLGLGALAWWLGASSPFLTGSGSAFQWLGNLSIVPLNYFMVAPSLEQFMPVPPAWSLGLELQFYLLAPWLMPRPRLMLRLGAATLGVSALATAGWLQTDWFGYRLLCGNLYLFLAGAWLYRCRREGASMAPLLALWCAVAAMAIWTAAAHRWRVPFTVEVQLGVLLGLPLLALLARRSRQHWDDAVGRAAYGVFLGHFPVMWLGGMVGWLSGDAHPMAVYLVLVLAASVLGHMLVERPLLAWRHTLRRGGLRASSEAK